jgi:hypothetical protein
MRSSWLSRFPAFLLARNTEIGIAYPRDPGPLIPAAPPREKRMANRAGDGADEEGGTMSLNFKVSPEFKKEFKGFAGSEGITMTDLLKEGFTLSKRKRKK